MRRTGRNIPKAPDTPRICPCGAQADESNDLCRKCRRRLRWLRRMVGRRRDQWREFHRSNFFYTEAVSPA